MYTVESYDNFHFGDPSGEWMKHGEFETAEKAIACAQKVIDEWFK